jgi:hypothetical protein
MKEPGGGKMRWYFLGGFPRRQFYSDPGHYFEGAKGRGVTALKWSIRKLLKVLVYAYGMH